MLFFRFFLLVLVFGCSSLQAADIPLPKRVALVIGNSNYQFSSQDLGTPIFDADDMTKELRKLKFEVTPIKNANKEQIINAITKFKNDTRDSDIALFYFAGHGFEGESGGNYLMPTNANNGGELLAQETSVSLRVILEKAFNSSSKNKIVLLDACRSTIGRAIGSPLGEVKERVDPNIIIAFATAPGTRADNSSSNNRNGLFTAGLLKGLKGNDLTIRGITDTAAEYVNRENQQQHPYIHAPPLLAKSLSLATETRATAATPAPAPSPPPVLNTYSQVTRGQDLIDNRYQPNAIGDEILDKDTGLTWKRCNEGQKWQDGTCVGEPTPFTYSIKRDGYTTALDQVKKYNGKYRLPTARELFSLVSCSSGQIGKYTTNLEDGGAVIKHGCLGEYERPTLDLLSFPNTPESYWNWSASKYKAEGKVYKDRSWVVYFSDGGVDGGNHDDTNHVRLVRSF